jgi:hypothetical protein
VLQQWFTASEFYQGKPRYSCGVTCRRIRERGSQTIDFAHDVHQFPASSFFESIRSIAIGTAQVASGQPHKNAREPSEGAFTLQAQINLIDDE